MRECMHTVVRAGHLLKLMFQAAEARAIRSMLTSHSHSLLPTLAALCAVQICTTRPITAHARAYLQRSSQERPEFRAFWLLQRVRKVESFHWHVRVSDTQSSR